MFNSENKKEYLERIERSLLELGTEIYCMKGEIAAVKGSHENLLEIIRGLKLILDDKGLITIDDFESAVDLGHALTNHASLDHALHASLEKLKKVGH